DRSPTEPPDHDHERAFAGPRSTRRAHGRSITPVTRGECTTIRALCDDRDTMADELSPSEVAARLGTTTRTVQRWIERGTLPARRVGGRWRVADDAIVAFEGAVVAHPAIERPIRRLFVANRGEIAAR